MKEHPYFMTNPEWYYHDEKDFRYKLTDKAPPNAVKSYNDFYHKGNDPEYRIN